jgi:hypothetical protein
MDPDAKAWWRWHASIAYGKCLNATAALRVSYDDAPFSRFAASMNLERKTGE